MRTELSRALAGAALLLAAGACRHRELIVVLPDASGHVGGVVVDDGRSERVLDTAGAAVRISGKSAAEPGAVPDDEIRRRFAGALVAEPLAMRRFVLHFDEGTERLVPESESQLGFILYDLRKRTVPEIEVLGHTDRTGTDEANLDLSDRRARFVREWLVSNGVPGESIVSVARGELDPVVPTEDGVSEPRNRRVEVTIR